MNPGTITGTLSWYKISPLSGYNLIRVIPKTSQETEKRVKEGTSAVSLHSGLDEKWLSDSMECYCYLRNVQDLLADGKTPYERRFGESFKGPIIPFGALVEYLPASERDKARNHQFGEKVLSGIFLGYALISGGIWKGDILIADIEELEKLDAPEISKFECKRSPDNTQKKRRICISCGRWFSKIIRRRLRIPRTHSETGIDRKERDSAENLEAIGKSFNLKNPKMSQKSEMTFSPQAMKIPDAKAAVDEE